MLFFIRTCVQENLISYLFGVFVYVLSKDLCNKFGDDIAYVILPGHDDDFDCCLLPGHICCTDDDFV